MKKEFLLNIILLLSINFLVKPLYLFGVDAHIQNIVGPEQYGVYFALFNLVFLFQFIIEPGIQSYNSRHIAQNPDQLGYHLPRIFGMKLVLFIGFILAIVVAFFTSGYSIDKLHLLLVIGANLFLSTGFIFLRSNIAAIGKYRTDSLLSVLDKLLMLFILGFLSWVPPFCEQFTLMHLVFGQFIALAVACIIALILLSKSIASLRPIFSLEYSKKLFRLSFPFILILLFMSAYTKLDGVMLERLLDDNGMEAGIYAAGYRFVDALNMIGYMMAALLLPMYSSNLKNDDVLEDLLYTGLSFITICAVVLAFIFIWYGDMILPLIYVDATPYYSEVLVYLMISFIGVSIAYLFGTLLVATDKLKELNILFLICVILNLVLNLYLIPLYQARGAAFATAITQTIVLLGQMYLVYRHTNVKFRYKIYLQVVAFGLLCALIFKMIGDYVSFSWIIQILICICVSGILAFVLGLINISGLIKMIQKRSTKYE